MVTVLNFYISYVYFCLMIRLFFLFFSSLFGSLLISARCLSHLISSHFHVNDSNSAPQTIRLCCTRSRVQRVNACVHLSYTTLGDDVIGASNSMVHCYFVYCALVHVNVCVCKWLMCIHVLRLQPLPTAVSKQ